MPPSRVLFVRAGDMAQAPVRGGVPACIDTGGGCARMETQPMRYGLGLLASTRRAHLVPAYMPPERRHKFARSLACVGCVRGMAEQPIRCRADPMPGRSSNSCSPSRRGIKDDDLDTKVGAVPETAAHLPCRRTRRHRGVVRAVPATAVQSPTCTVKGWLPRDKSVKKQRARCKTDMTSRTPWMPRLRY